ncbi:MAG: hypothetical protein K0U52_06275, partial [Gammaproteobacteria bacterium]|nr:hypothetical protein [Gammaproteobacteria bacterium]
MYLAIQSLAGHKLKFLQINLGGNICVESEMIAGKNESPGNSEPGQLKPGKDLSFSHKTKMDLLPDLEAANQQLIEQGWTVIPNILSPRECEQGIDGIWEWLAFINPNIQRHDPESWSNRNWPVTMHQIIQHYGVGQQEFVWNIRTHPKVKQVFSYLWDTNNLITSFDGINVTRPPETGYIQFHNDQRSWLHLDQGPKTSKRSQTKRHRRKKDPTCACIQGFVSLEDAAEDDAVLQLYQGSHHLHEAFFDHLHASNRPASDWYKLTADDRQWYLDRGCQHLRIAVP